MATNGEMVKRKLFDLRVVDLKAELENRNLDKAGIKAVLLERLQQALEKEGHNCDDYFFEVTESPIAKKPTKRTNKKLTRDDESETHSNVDESQNDLNLEDDDKFDSDEDRIDEKVLETTEDTINLSIEEEEEKLLIEEDISSEGEKQADSDDFKRNGKSSGEAAQNVSRSPKRETTKSQALNLASNSSSTSDQESATVGSEVSANVSKDSAVSKSGDQGKAGSSSSSGATTAGGSGGDLSGIRSEDKGESSGAGGSTVSSSAAKNPNGNESKENAAAAVEGNTAAVVRPEETSSSGASAASPNKAKSTAVKEGAKFSAERAKLARPLVSGKNLWVTGLSSATRATDLKSLFSKHGKVLGAKVVSNARSSVSRCYGFITMATAEEASKCIQHLHRTELHGRMISVERAKADPLGPGRKVAVRQTTVTVAKKTPLKKDATSSVVRIDGPEKKSEEDIVEKKEKAKVKDDEVLKEPSGPEIKDLIDDDNQIKEIIGGDTINEEKGSKRSIDDRRDSIRRSTRDSRERRGSERSYEHHRENFLSHRRPYFRDKFMRRPFMRRPVGYRSMMRRNTLTFDRIRAERLRQRAREEERELRDSERKRRLDIARQREIERRQREEAVRLERERERLRIEREKLERERAEVLRLEREKQKLERERIEREREELRRRERMSFSSRMDEHRRPVKRSYNSFHSGRDVDYEERKRANISGGPRRIENFERRSDHRTESIRGGGGGGIGRRDSHVPERGNDSRTERFERPVSRDTDLRGHGREDRSVSYRDSSEIGRTVKDEWKAGGGSSSGDRGGRGHRDSGKGMSSSSYDGGRSGGESRYTGDRGDTWHGNSQSESRGSGSKPYNTGGGSSGWGGSERKSDSQWGSSRNDSWGGGSGGGGGGIGSVRSQQLGMSQSIMSQGQSSMFESGSGSGGGGGGGGGSSGMIGLGIGGSSYSSDRFDSYKGMNSMRRY